MELTGQISKEAAPGEDGPFLPDKNTRSGWEIITLANKFYLQLLSLKAGCLFCSLWLDVCLCKWDDLKVCANRWNSHGRWVVLGFWFYSCMCRRVQVSLLVVLEPHRCISTQGTHFADLLLLLQTWALAGLSDTSLLWRTSSSFFHSCPVCLQR